MFNNIESIETNEDFLSFIKWSITNEKYAPQICNNIKFKYISFGENFNAFNIDNIYINKIIPTRLYSDANTGVFTLRGIIESGNCNRDFCFEDFIFNKELLIKNKNNIVGLVYDENNKDKTFDYIHEMYNQYSKNIIYQIEFLEKGYIMLKREIINGWK